MGKSRCSTKANDVIWGPSLARHWRHLKWAPLTSPIASALPAILFELNIGADCSIIDCLVLSAFPLMFIADLMIQMCTKVLFILVFDN